MKELIPTGTEMPLYSLPMDRVVGVSHGLYIYLSTFKDFPFTVANSLAVIEGAVHMFKVEWRNCFPDAMDSIREERYLVTVPTAVSSPGVEG